MNPFSDDPFDSIVREFFGRDPFRQADSKSNKILSSEDDQRMIDYIEDEIYAYTIFELPGYDEKDITVSIKGHELSIKAKKKVEESVDNYIAQKLNRGITITKTLPKNLITKGYESHFRNGVLEICFKKK